MLQQTLRPLRLQQTMRDFVSLASYPRPNSLVQSLSFLVENHPTCRIFTRTMAGHNKWSKIRHKKGANDVKKALLLGKASKSLTMIAKECKGDRSDPRLQAAIQHAKLVKLPKDRIEDAIERARGSSGSDEYFPLRFDAMMRLQDSSNNDSVQVAFIVTALSDNRNRTTQNIRHLVNKHGGEFLPTDHLNYLFQKVGHIYVEAKEQQECIADLEEELMECALEAGATNFEEVEDEDVEDIDEAPANTRFLVTTAETDLWKVARAISAGCNNAIIANCEHTYVLKDEFGTPEFINIQSESEAHQALDEFLDKLEEDEDVDKVYHNAELE